MMTVAELAIEVNAPTEKAEANLSHLSGTVEQGGGIFSRFSGMAAGALSTLMGFVGAEIVSGVFDRITSSITDLITTGFNFDESMQMLHAQLTAITGSGGAADKLLAWAKQFGQSVPDTTEHLDQAIVTIESLGLNAQQVMPALANVAAAMGTDLPTAAQAFADAYEGRFAMLQMNLHVTKEQLVAYGLDLNNIQGTLVTALQNFQLAKFPDGLKESMTTFHGQLSNMIDRFQAFAGLVMQPVFDLFQHSMEAVGTWLDSHKQLVTDVANAIGTGLAGALHWVATEAGNVAGLLSQIPFGTIAQTIGNLFSGIGGAGAGLNFGGIVSSLSSFGQTIQTQVMPIAVQLSDWFRSQLMPAIASVQPAIQSFGNFIVSTVIPAFIQFEANAAKTGATIGKLLLPIFEKIEPIVVKLGGWLLDMGQKALAFLIPKVMEASKAISDFASEMATRLGPFISRLANDISVFADIVSKVWTALWPTILAVLKYAWDLISNVIKTAWDLITGIFKIGADILSGNWGQLWQDVLGLVHSVGDDIKNTIFTWLGDLGNIIATSPVGQFFSKFIIQPIKDAVQSAIGWIEGLWQAFIDWISGKGGSAPNPTSSGNYGKGGSGARASGGPVFAGGAYTVGENRRELFVPQQDGYIIPNKQTEKLLAGGKGGHTFNINGTNVNYPQQLMSLLQREAALHPV